MNRPDGTSPDARTEPGDSSLAAMTGPDGASAGAVHGRDDASRAGSGRWRWAGYGAGGALVVVGLAGLAADAHHTDPLGWALWFGGLVAAHDGVLAPLVAAVAVLTGAVREPYRFWVRAALAVAGVLGLLALPMVLGIGRRADNPSLLPLDYGRNLLLVLAAVAVAAAAAMAAARLRARRTGRARPFRRRRTH
ncbi:hypothetical protein ABZT47_18475 [Sphaerisporangium sp. NPDC005289]|uniref:hypothetical protein n=1 Tax=Sphaerisporangium sp. NPDC005289 TaxID=3155247 RepID=UPI0033B95A5C